MAKDMLINVSEGEECRIAIVEDGRLEELYIERTSSTSHVGNIYKGKVTNVEASIQAAFIDFGLGRNGFLHVSDLLPDYFGKKGEDVEEYVGKKMARRDRPPIQRCLRRGDEIIVQVIKEGIGTKGPTLSSYLSVSGKMLVMMPGVSGRGVSRKIEDEQERRRLKQILDSLDPPDDCGFIIRTEAVGKSKTDVERDLKYLARLWDQMKKKRDASNGPTELYTEGDLVTRTIRDFFNTDVDRVVVDNPEVAERVKDVVRLTSPRAKDKVETHESPIPLLHKYGIERDIELMYSRHVPLPSGGSLVIDSTEAIVAIDVNSGKFREHSDAETTAFKTDMEAADEICRQLKLRDLGGVIIVDFIDLRYERHRRDLEQRIVDNFKKDRAKTKVLRMSQFGIIEITRQRMRPSLKRSVYFDCPHCKGAGLVKTPESMSLDVMRRLAIAMNDLKVARAELGVCSDVALYLNNKKRRVLADLEDRTKKRVVVKIDASLGLDEMKLDLYDNRDGMVLLPELSEVLTSHPHTSQLHTRPPGRHTPSPGPNGGGRGGTRPEQRRPDRERELADDRLEFEEEDREPQGEPGRDEERSGDSRPRDEQVREGQAKEGRRRGEPRRDDQRRDDQRRGDDRGELREGGEMRPQRDDRGARPQRDRQPQGQREGHRNQPRADQGRSDRARADQPQGDRPRGDQSRSGQPRRDDRPADARRDQSSRETGPDRNESPPAAPAAGGGAPAGGMEEGGTGEGGGRRRRRRRRGRGRGGQDQGQTQPLTAFGDYPDDAERPSAAGLTSDVGEGGALVASSAAGDAEHDAQDALNRDYQAATVGEAREDDDLGPAPEPIESEYEDDLAFEPESESESAQSADGADQDREASEHGPRENLPREVSADESAAEVSDESPAGKGAASQAEPQAGRGGRRRPVRAKAAAEKSQAGKSPARSSPARSSAGRASSAKAPKPATPAKGKGKPSAAAAPAAKASSTTTTRGKRTTKKSGTDAKAPAETKPASGSRTRIADATPAPSGKARGADKHLVAPEADPEADVSTDVPTPRRSRSSYRDLDAIPDDYD